MFIILNKVDDQRGGDDSTKAFDVLLFKEPKDNANMLILVIQ